MSSFSNQDGGGILLFGIDKKRDFTVCEIDDKIVASAEIPGIDGKRNDKPEYPVRIIIYSDRMEIINEGGLYGKLTIDSLGKIHADTRNQKYFS